MKTSGWICLVLGILSFIGAALKEDGLLGPTFVIALGAFLLYRATHKEQEHKDNRKVSAVSSASINNQQINQSTNKFPGHVVDTQVAGNKSVGLDEIQSHLTLQQREASMCLISFFGGFNNNLLDDAPMMIFKQAAAFFGIPDSPIEVSQIMAKYSDADTLVDTVLTIKDIKAKEFLLLSCYDLIKSAGNSEADELLFNIARDMGYNKDKFLRLISAYS
jgi:hypothetical protein